MQVPLGPRSGQGQFSHRPQLKAHCHGAYQPLAACQFLGQLGAYNGLGTPVTSGPEIADLVVPGTDVDQGLAKISCGSGIKKKVPGELQTHHPGWLIVHRQQGFGASQKQLAAFAAGIAAIADQGQLAEATQPDFRFFAYCGAQKTCPDGLPGPQGRFGGRQHRLQGQGPGAPFRQGFAQEHP